ncbi:MAG TPA: TIGR01777 family oxidoreductase [Opitutaceae bacterium]|nr:TIGR01777 family oxidoreductase [Opitutaceae bacterium]
MNILIAGGTGQVGAILRRAFEARGDSVTLLCRNQTAQPGCETVHWDGKTLGSWTACLDETDVLINLCGRSVNCRYTKRNRREILESRVDTTAVLLRALQKSVTPPKVWLQASTATIYSHRFDRANDELEGEIGGRELDVPESWRFSIEVAKRWEAAATAASLPNTRVVLMRSALILSPDRGGIFDMLLHLVRLGVGGRAGSGRQFVSWIHENDFIAAVLWLITHSELSGPVNLAAPNPLPNQDFMETLCRAWGKKFALAGPAWLLPIAAYCMRTETELILKSRRVVPTRLIQSNFGFTYPAWPEAARELCERWLSETRPQ